MKGLSNLNRDTQIVIGAIAALAIRRAATDVRQLLASKLGVLATSPRLQ
jgi:hypothetical protein